MLIPVIYLFAWNHGSCHFNSAMTLAEYIFVSNSVGEYLKGIVPTLIVFVLQFVGAVAGYGISMAINKVWTDANTNRKTISPNPPVLCPGAAIGGAGNTC
jgi:hypothetical protein